MIKFPMKYLNISQGRFTNFSHSGLNAYDLAGKNSGKDYFYAFGTNYKITENLSIGNGNGTIAQSQNKIQFKNGDIDYITLLLWHNDNAQHSVGTIVKNGEALYREGNSGYSFGNHIHLEIGKGKLHSLKKSNGETTLPNHINIENVFYFDKNYNILVNGVYNFLYKEEWEELKFMKTHYYTKMKENFTKYRYYNPDVEFDLVISNSWSTGINMFYDKELTKKATPHIYKNGEPITSRRAGYNDWKTKNGKKYRYYIHTTKNQYGATLYFTYKKEYEL